jgi:ABC-type multidrug transport system ATPase subunit
MLDLSFLGNAPIGVASSAGRHAFVSGTALSTKADPSHVVALAGDAARTLLADGVVAPFAGVDKLWDCSADSLVLDACAHTCPRCGPRETALLPTDTLEHALVEKLASSVKKRSEFYETVSSTGSTNRSGTTPTFLFDAFASLDGALLANTKPRATCAFGRHSFMSTCASLFVEPGAMDTSRPIPRNEPRRFAYTVLTSSTAYHALPAAMAVAHDAIFRTILGSETETIDADDLNASASSSSVSRSSNTNGSLIELPFDREEKVSLVSINHPLPSTETEKQEKALLSRLLVSLCVVVSLSALSASAAAPFPAREMNTGAKHLQIVSGMRRDAYWCGTFLWDVCLQTPTLAATLLLLTAGGIAGEDEEHDASSRVLTLVVALALFVVSATPLVYVIGSLVKFASPAAAVASTLALFVFFGVAQLIAAVTLGGLAGAGAAGPAATNAWRACRFIFLWLPHYCVGRVVFDASGGFGDASAWASDAGVETFSSSQLDEKNESRSSFRIPATSTEALIAMGTGAVVYASLALLLERAEENKNASSSSISFGRRPKRVWAEIVSRLRGETTSRETTSSVSEATDDLERGEVNRAPRRSSGGFAQKGSSRPAHAPFANDSVSSFETDTVVSSRLGNAALVVRGLRKKFRGKPPVSDIPPLPLEPRDLRHKKEEKRRFAVDDVTFDVARGESFALLGVNGAGKTTTFEMLTGALKPTTGDAYVVTKNDGDDSDEGDDSNDEAKEKRTGTRFLSLRRDADAFRRAVGYCPQRDALFESLSAREHLLFYGALRGLSSEESADAVARVCDAVGLRGALVTRPAREYSGGNKRALAVAIALMGDPACVLLDEPSTGMDPRAKRKLWRALDAASKLSGVAFVLTSHSMEEAEAVCGRAGLVEAGTLRHVGDVESWRAALGTGHALEMRLRDASPKRRQAVAEFVRETFRVPTKTKTETSSRGGVLDGVDLFDAESVVVFSDDARLGRLMKCRVPLCVPLSFVFRQVELNRDALGVEEYQVGAATLEETFLRFASRADDERAMRLS